MKLKTLLGVAMLITAGALAQEKKDTTTIVLGKSKIIIISDQKDTSITISESDSISKSKKKNKFRPHWGGVDIGINGYLNADNSFSLDQHSSFLTLNQPKSLILNVNFAEIDVKLCKKYVGLVSGAGFQFNNYRFDRNIKLNSDSAYLTYSNDSLKYRKNKLVVTYLTIPVLIEFQIPVNEKKDKLYIAAGMIGGLRIGTHLKQIYQNDGDKIKERKDYHLASFMYNLTARAGYNGVGLFVNYNLSPLFRSNEGPELYPWSAGISLSF